MSFDYRAEDGSVVDDSRQLILRLLGGREDESYAIFLFSAPDCSFEVQVYYHYSGLEFTYPGVYDELGRETAVISHTATAEIELQFAGFMPRDGTGDPLIYTGDVKEALASHYTFNGRYKGPVYLLTNGPDGRPTRERISLRTHPSALSPLKK